MKKIFTFLVAFLTTLSGAVWGQEYGSSSNPLDLNGRSESIRITDDKQEWYITSTSETNNVGIIIQGPPGSGDVIYPRIHLINVQAIDVPSTAIEIHDRAQPTLILEGENKIYSDDGPAIYVQNLPNTKLNIEGTGSLEIIMTHSDNVAIGNSIGGADRPADCGGITVNSGTVVTNGVIGSMCTYDFTVNNNAVFIVNNLDKSPGVGDLKLNGGIWGENPDGIGYIQGDERTLDSPLPDGYKINLESGKKLTIGDDQILNEDQLIDNGGQIKGYKVVYSSPTDVPMNVSGQLPANKFVGSKYTVEQWNANASVKEENTTYKHIATHWLQGGTTWVSANSEVSEIPATQYTTLSAIGTKEYQAVWYLDEKTVSYSLMTGFNGAFNLWYPEVEPLFDATEQSGNDFKTLAQVGLKLTDENGNTVVAGTPIVEEGTFKTNLDLASSTTNAPTGLVTKLTTVTVASESELNLGNDDEVSITFNGGDFTYNGKEQTEVGNMVSVKSVKNPDLSPTYGMHYFLKFSQDGTDAKFQDKGDYTVTVVAIEGNGLLTGQKELTDKATIKPAKLTAKATEAVVQVGIGGTVEESIAISNNDETQYVEFAGLVNGEQAVYTGTLKRNESVNVDTSTEGEVKNAYTVDNVTLTAEGSFDPNNYTTPTYESVNVSVVVGKITINPGDDGSGEGGDEVTGGDTGEDEQPNTDDDFILISPEGKDKCSVYDGYPHGLDWLRVGDEVLLKDVDYSVLYNGGETEPVNAGGYIATITLEEDGNYKLENGKSSFTLALNIIERPVTVDFGHYPSSIDISTETLDASQYAIWQKAGEVANEGLVEGETPECEGTLALVESEEHPGYFDVYLERETFKVNDTKSFLASNYAISVKDKDGNLIKLEDGEGEEGGATLPGDGDDPLIDDPDSDNPIRVDDGGNSGSGITTKRYQLYLANKDYNVKDAKEDYAAEGLELFSRHNKKYTNAGSSFTVWYEKDGVANAGGYRIFWSNRANGEYKEVKFDTVSEYFQIRNVQSDVYVKIYAADGFPVGNEEISAADYRAYAQPNKIVVITPQPTDVQIISMAGAVVATDKVTGQREFANLTEGVYIVRMGETVVKLQVRK